MRLELQDPFSDEPINPYVILNDHWGNRVMIETQMSEARLKRAFREGYSFGMYGQTITEDMVYYP